MGYVFCLGHCVGCGRLFTFNPLRVPSLLHPVSKTREPICRSCVDAVNPQRVANGVPPIVPLPDAYDEVSEEELS